MKKEFFASALLIFLCSSVLIAQSNTEIFLLDFKIWHDQFSVSNPRNVTNNAGFYDNQPFFLPDGDSFMYSSMDESGKTDIYLYNIKGGTKRRLTYTPEVSEYSPTVTPEKNAYSCVILEDDGTQKLWKYYVSAPIANLITNLAPVGYHAWYSLEQIALFIVGNDNKLVLVNLTNGQSREVDDKIGTSLYRIPGKNKVSYISQKHSDDWKIMSVDMDSYEVQEIVSAIPGQHEYYTWTPDGILVMGDGVKLFKFDPAIDQEWVELVDLSAYGINSFTRIAINPQISKLAVVVDE